MRFIYNMLNFMKQYILAFYNKNKTSNMLRTGFCIIIKIKYLKNTQKISNIISKLMNNFEANVIALLIFFNRFSGI